MCILVVGVVFYEWKIIGASFHANSEPAEAPRPSSLSLSLQFTMDMASIEGFYIMYDSSLIYL